MFFGASPSTFAFARELRKKETLAEKKLWSRISRKKLGARFRRQHPLFKFVVDFYSHEIRLAIEVDGGIHQGSEAISYDEMRTTLINEFGIEVIRFTNEEVFNEIDEVIAQLQQIINERADLSTP